MARHERESEVRPARRQPAAFHGNQLRFSGELEQGLRLGGVSAAFTFNAILCEHSSILGGGW
jgi:hypothetical protein